MNASCWTSEGPIRQACRRLRHLKMALMGRPSSKDRDRIILPDYAEGIQIKTDDEDARFNNALARGLAILRAFERREELTDVRDLDAWLRRVFG